MGRNDINNSNFDYYNNTRSYFKTIIDMVPSDALSNEKKDILALIYNYILNNFNSIKKTEISYVTAMFMEKVSTSSIEEINKQVDYIFNNFIIKILYDGVNREKIFDIMNECVKLYVGYYSDYEIITANVNGVTKEKCCYR